MIKNVSGIKIEACVCVFFHNKYWYSIIWWIYMAQHYEYMWFFTKGLTKELKSLNDHIHD